MNHRGSIGAASAALRGCLFRSLLSLFRYAALRGGGIIRHSPFAIRHSPFAIRHSPNILIAVVFDDHDEHAEDER
jgi:hypothetical protein